MESNLSLFQFMLSLRANPRMLVKYFPQITESAYETEPRNLSKELRGTVSEMRDFMVVYGFGRNLDYIVAVAFHPTLDPYAEPAWAADHETLKRVFKVTPIVLALASDPAVEDVINSRKDLN